MATITVPSESPKKQVVVGGTPQTSFTFDFVIFDTSTDLKVYNGDTLLTGSTHYTVSGNAGTDGGFDGGTVTLVNTLASGVSNTTVTILRNISTDRLANLASTGPLDIDAVNKDFNRYVSMLQQFEETVDRSVQAPEQDPTQRTTATSPGLRHISSGSEIQANDARLAQKQHIAQRSQSGQTGLRDKWHEW